MTFPLAGIYVLGFVWALMPMKWWPNGMRLTGLALMASAVIAANV